MWWRRLHLGCIYCNHMRCVHELIWFEWTYFGVCGPMCCLELLGCSSRGLATCTTGGWWWWWKNEDESRRSRQGGEDGGKGREERKGKASRVWAEGCSPGIRCCQDNSQQRYLLRRTKQNYQREQKSANTCLGGSYWGKEREKKGEDGRRPGAVY